MRPMPRDDALAAVVVLVPEAEPVVGRWRQRLDPSARTGMPAHCTLVYPFAPHGGIGEGVIERLRSLFSGVERFGVSFADTGRFDAALYLAPDPDLPLRRLTAAIVRLWPESPPYGGAFDQVVPHLTVASEVDPAALGEVERDVRTQLPIHAELREAALYTVVDGRWRLATRFPFEKKSRSGHRELVIRRYRATDHAAVWELHNLALNQVGAHAGNGPWDEDLAAIERVYLDASGDFVVGEVDSRIVAMGALKRSDNTRAEIKRMRVHPDFQGRGFGTRILLALERRARDLGYEMLHLDTTTKQAVAQTMYRRHGYSEVGRDRHGEFELVLFEKRLDGSVGA